jgi:hypothetical protein
MRRQEDDMHALTHGLRNARGDEACATTWPRLVVDVLEDLSDAHPEPELEDLARRAREADGAGDRTQAMALARQAAREALGLLARDRGFGADCFFRREGEYWAIGRPDSLVRLRDSVGLHHLAQLLRDPGREFAAVDLVARRFGARPAVGDAGEMLDARAKAEYRRRIEDLRDQIEEAERFGDLERMRDARTQVQVVARELARAVGLGGRSRVVGSFAERARVNVTRTIRDAMRRIGGQDVWVGHHLVTTIRTGMFCCYTPEPDICVRWVL